MDSWDMQSPMPGSQNDLLARGSKSLPANNYLTQEHNFQAKTTDNEED